MAHELRGSVQGGHGERLSIEVGRRALGIQAKDIVTSLLILMLGVGGYLLYDAISKDLGRLDRQHDQVLAALQQNALRIVEAIQQANNHREEQTEAIRV